MSTVLVVAGAIACVAGGASGLYVLVVKPLKAFNAIQEKFGDFMEDWFGTEERPGVPARQGVMLRLATIEDQLHPNHGTSLRDVADRLERGQRRVEDTLSAHLEDHRALASAARRKEKEGDPDDADHRD